MLEKEIGSKEEKVHQSCQDFKKVILNNESDYEAVFHKIIRYDRNNPQTLKKYQADESKYDTKKEIKRDSIWKSANKVIWA